MADGTCTTCGRVVSSDAERCSWCGAPGPAAPAGSGAPSICPQCRAQVQPGLQFCPHCGADTADAPERAASAPTPSVAERAPIDPRGAEAIAATLWTLGGLFGAIGLYYLVLAPGEGGASVLGRELVNFHRLAIGLAGSTAGAVFLTGAAIVTAINRHLEVSTRLAARAFDFYLEAKGQGQ